MVTPRIMKETKGLLQNSIVGIQVEIDSENPRHFIVKLLGPDGTPYEGG